MEFVKWHTIYAEEKILDITKELTKTDLNILARVNIKIEDIKFAMRDIEVLYQEVISYIIDDEIEEECIEYYKELKNTDVTQKEFDRVHRKIEKIFSNTKIQYN